MKKMRFEHDEFTFERINKKTARIAFNNGLPVIFCPVNMPPFSMWYNASAISKKDSESFESVLNAFECYNCNSETGRYTAFYIPVKWIDWFNPENISACESDSDVVKVYDYDFMVGENFV